MPLTEAELTMLTLERHTWRHAGAKEQAVRDRLGVSVTAYYQRLNALLDTEVALAADPVTVRRLRRVRESRVRARSTG